MGKSSYHKSENTFRFQTFSERIADINIDVIHKIRHHDDTPEEDSTYFGEALEKWTEFNCTQHFTDFRCRISHQVQTFTQLVHHEDTIVSALKEHLLVPNSLAYEPLLDLLVQLARDLQTDFYKHFREFFDILVALLNNNPQDTELLEKMFSALSYLFKFLWRYLVKDIRTVYGFFSDLLSENYKPYIRHFAAESFAFLMRKVKDHGELFDFLFKSLKKSPEKAEGVGWLMFEMMKGVKHKFHSCTEKVFPILLSKAGHCQQMEKVVKLPWSMVETCLTHTLGEMAQHTDKDNTKQIWSILLNSISKVHTSWMTDKGDNLLTAQHLDVLLRLSQIWMEFKKGDIVNCPDQIANTLLTILKGPVLPETTGRCLVDVLSAFLISAHSSISVFNTAKLVSAVFKANFSCDLVKDFTLSTDNLLIFEKDVLPGFITHILDRADDNLTETSLSVFAEILMKKVPFPKDGETLDTNNLYPLDFSADKGSKYLNFLMKTITSADCDTWTNIENLDKVWFAVLCLPHLKMVNDSRCDRIQCLVDLKDKVLAYLEKGLSEKLTDNLLFLSYTIVLSLFYLQEDGEIYKHIEIESIKNLLMSHSSNMYMLSIADLYTSQALATTDILTEEIFLEIFPALEDNLTSWNSKVRLLSLRIMSQFPVRLPSIEELDPARDSVFQTCMSAENTPLSVQDYRQRIMYIQRLEFDILQNSIPVGPFSQVAVRYLIGSLFCNFKLLWEPTIKLIAGHARGLNKAAFWEMFNAQLLKAAEKSEAYLKDGKPVEQNIEELPVLEQIAQQMAARKSNEKPDYTMFRLHLWKAMQLFPEVCESKSKDVSPLLFRFLKNEYYLSDETVAPTQNICKKHPKSPEKDAMQEEVVKNKEFTKRRISIVQEEEEDNLKTEKKGDKEKDKIPTGPAIIRRSRRLSARSEDESGDISKPNPMVTRARKSSTSISEEPTTTESRSRVRRSSASMTTEVANTVSATRTRSQDSNSSCVEEEVSTTRVTRSRKSSVSVEGEKSGEVPTEVQNVRRSSRLRKSSISTAEDHGESNVKSEISEEPTARDNVSEEEKQENRAGDSAHEDRIRKKRTKAAASTLVVHLELFAKFRNPKSLHMEPELRMLYFDLLGHRNPDVQKVAFDCIMTYKYKYLVPYSENFQRLFDDKTFRTELVMFSLDEETAQISKEHRIDVLPVLMRLLHGKMQTKTGNETSGRNNSSLRQSIVFRFLGGCSSQEIGTFLDMVFASYKHFVRDNPMQLVLDTMKNTNLTAVIPLRKIVGAIKSIETICKKMGHLMDDYLSTLLRILLGFMATCVSCLEKREELTGFSLNVLKDIRQLSIGRLIQFFDDFDEYKFTPVEIDAIFHVAVWPQLDKLHHESLYHATPLLKMLKLWSKSSRYILLLSVHHPQDASLSPMVHVFKLLNAATVQRSVTGRILDMVDNLLNLTNEDVDNTSQPLPVNNGLSLHKEDGSLIPVEELGVSLVMPHLPALLQYLQKSIVDMKTNLGKKGECKELNILSRVSSYVSDGEQCRVLISLLLPYLDKAVTRSTTVEEGILTTVNNLMKKTNDSWSFYRPVCRLFSWISSRSSRIILCSIFEAILTDKIEMGDLSGIVLELNSWDPKRVEEPDYLKRLSAFKKINSHIRAMETISVDFLFPIMHNCCYFIRMIDDLSIRDNSTHCMINMVKLIGSAPFDQEVLRELVTQGLLAEIKNGVKDKNENVRHEFIALLSTLVGTFPNQPMFADLLPLKDQDVEADFFENIRHIQTYKRARALRKMIKFITSKPCKKEILTSYFLPITSSFIVDSKYAKVEALMDAAVDAMGTICRQLPWQLYYFQLKYFISLLSKHLDKQKLLVRVLVAILDNFHFDLSHSSFTMTTVSDSITKQKEAGLPTDEEENEVTLNEESLEEPPTVAMDTGDMTPSKDSKDSCSPALATRIHNIIVNNLLPQLQTCLTEKVQSDDEHKKASLSKYAEDTEILRVPIALAMVKLLQNVIPGSLRHTLPGILLKVCNFLKSRSRDIRDASRDTLSKILLSLGPKFFPFVLSEMRSTLRRGYQMHVLGFTVYYLLKNILPITKPGDLDCCHKSLQEVFHEELFGSVSEEKEVDGITGKLFEAKLVKSYESYFLLSSRIGTKCLISMITPLKQILDSTHSHKTVNRVLDLLKKIVVGLTSNEGISTEELTIFVHGLVSEAFPQLTYKESKTSTIEEEDPRKKPESCLILEKEPPRGGLKPKKIKRNNAHVVIQFGLQILNELLKKSRLLLTETKHLEMLDPFIEILAESLHSNHIKVNIVSLRCLMWLLKFPLPSLKDSIKKISEGLFIVLRSYSSVGTAGGDNLELITVAFKTVTVLVRDVLCHNIDNKQLQVLLSYCEEDLYDHNRQSTAFSLLKAILSRKLNIPEVPEIMQKIMNMSITQDSPHVRRESRQLTLQYLMDYPLGKKLIKNLEFFVGQLTYEMESGRESALEMLATIFSSFPQSILVQYAGFFFVPMSAALVNDDSSKCRKLTGLAIKSLIGKLDHNNRNELFSIAKKWFQDPKLQHKALGAQLFGLFVEVEAAQFERHLPIILPLIQQQTNPDKFNKHVDDESEEDGVAKLLYHTLNALVKICRDCNVLRQKKWERQLNTLLVYTEHYLNHPHNWVRLVAAQLFGLLFAAYKPEDLLSAATGRVSSTEYLLSNTIEKLEKLAFAFCGQLQSRYLSPELAGQIVKNMVFVVKVTNTLKLTEIKRNELQNDNDDDELFDEDENTPVDRTQNKGDGKSLRRLCVPWLVRKMVREANHEAIKNNKVTLKRSSVFKWMAAASLDLGVEVLPSVVHMMIPPLQREINDDAGTSDAELKNLAQEVMDLLKNTMGVEAFSTIYAEIQKFKAQRREERKRQRAVEAVSNPEIAAKRKLKKNLAKKEAKKRRIEEFRPAKKIKKQRMSDFDVVS